MSPELGERGEGWVVLQVVGLAAVAVSALVGPRLPGGLRPPARAAGIVLMAAGGWLAAPALRQLGKFLTPLPRPSEGAALVQEGRYAVVRHPIYGGLVLLSTGVSFVSTRSLALASSAALAAFFRLKAGHEEAFLLERFPAYPAYRQRTPRLLLPWVSRT